MCPTLTWPGGIRAIKMHAHITEAQHKKLAEWHGEYTWAIQNPYLGCLRACKSWLGKKKSFLELFYMRINMSVMYKIDCKLGRFVKRPHYLLFSKAQNCLFLGKNYWGHDSSDGESERLLQRCRSWDLLLGDTYGERSHLETTTVTSLSDLQKPEDLSFTRHQ